ncbi:MAG: type II toxin-antitoxin system RelE/ParE family toxin [Armatimonadetes bacterium]|nr:type II toxin-antitoxin system RelE/ParE family toxin [Armatimonadota bacterium]
MARIWIYFDFDVIRQEFAKLPVKDRAKLLALMEHYAVVGNGNPSPARIDDYGGGLYRLRHIKSAYQGRVIFFSSHKAEGNERLVVLTVFKKETRSIPASILDRARARQAEYLRRNKLDE